jgi:PAS domain S-box-containing protein
VREVEEVARALAEADSALRDSETRLRLALRSAGLGAWENDLVKGNNLWDAQMAALLGFPSVERTGSTARALPLVHPDDRERVRLAYNHAAASGEPYREEFRIRRQDGAERILLSHGVLASTGRMVGVSQDMTDIRASEAAARQALGELNAIYDTAPVGLCVLDAQMRYVHLNARLAEINGIPLEAHVGRTVREVVPAIADAVEAVHHRVMQTGEPSLGLELGADHWPPDGSPRVWDQDWLPLRDDTGRVIGVNVVIEDVTQKRFAERALVESEARFRMLADVMPQVVWSTGPEGVHDYVNARWFEFTGLAQEAATPGISNEQRWSFSVHPDDLGRSIDLWRRSLRTGEPYEREHRMLRHDGVYRWVLSRAMPMRDEAGVVTRWFGTTTDIDDTVAAREALTRSSEDLERLVAERTRDLETTQARLAQAQRMEALGQLAGGIAHDFNNVLQSVQGCAELIERRSGDNERVRGLARTVMEAASRGSAVTGRLLAFARRGKLRAEAVDVEAMLDGLAEILTHTLGTGLDVRIEASAQLAPLFADKGQLETVLVNLATNARDAMAGNGALTLAARMEMVKRSGRIRHPAGLPTGEYVRLSVADTGAGMAPEVLARASEPFFTTKPLAQGTGLGLAMARGFAEQSGGGMRIESTPGQGTTVMLWFPVAGCGAHPASLSPRPPDLSFATAIGDPPIRLLLVDDDATVRETLAEQLEDAGYTVLRARDGEDALSLLDGGKAVDLMLSDLSMPGMDGVALIAAAQRLRPGLPAILLTGFATNATEIAADGAAAGAFSLLRKPIDVRHLTERVSDLLKQRALICG